MRNRKGRDGGRSMTPDVSPPPHALDQGCSSWERASLSMQRRKRCEGRRTMPIGIYQLNCTAMRRRARRRTESSLERKDSIRTLALRLQEFEILTSTIHGPTFLCRHSHEAKIPSSSPASRYLPQSTNESHTRERSHGTRPPRLVVASALTPKRSVHAL